MNSNDFELACKKAKKPSFLTNEKWNAYKEAGLLLDEI